MSFKEFIKKWIASIRAKDQPEPAASPKPPEPKAAITIKRVDDEKDYVVTRFK